MAIMTPLFIDTAGNIPFHKNTGLSSIALFRGTRPNIKHRRNPRKSHVAKRIQ